MLNNTATYSTAIPYNKLRICAFFLSLMVDPSHENPRNPKECPGLKRQIPMASGIRAFNSFYLNSVSISTIKRRKKTWPTWKQIKRLREEKFVHALSLFNEHRTKFNESQTKFNSYLHNIWLKNAFLLGKKKKERCNSVTPSHSLTKYICSQSKKNFILP